MGELLRSDVAARLAMTGETISGARAAELGLATECVEDPMAAAEAFAAQVATRSPDSVAATKLLLLANRRGGTRRAYRRERRWQSRMFKAANTRVARRAATTDEDPQFGPRSVG